MPRTTFVRALLLFALSLPAQAQIETAGVSVPRVDHAPRLEDFLNMTPGEQWKGLAKLDGFIQKGPDDGKPGSERTEVYLGYDDRNLYVVILAFDREPQKIRALLTRRDSATIYSEEDHVGILIDTFQDRRRAYWFRCNPLGVQSDAIFVEDESSHDDVSFDTVWSSRARLTDRGYVAWMAIPFRALRFDPSASRNWGFSVYRWIARRSEDHWWPRVTQGKRGIITQEGALSGIADVSPGRNIQLNPFVAWRAFRALDTSNPSAPAYTGRRADANVGLDAKIVIRDRLVFDATMRPDFSQVESDEPQSVVNQRYEVFFPEKRPFFTENADYFAPRTDARLFFSRRIADPQFGARLTGKLGPYSLGVLTADDAAPGESVADGDPLEGRRAHVGVFRLSRDLPGGANVGAMYTERRLAGSYNRLTALDGTVRFGKNTSATVAVADSWTRGLDGAKTSGALVEASLRREGRGFNYKLLYLDRARDFRTDLGYVHRSDIRQVTPTVSYKFQPRSRWLKQIQPSVDLSRAWDKSGTLLLSHYVAPKLTIELRQPTTFELFYWNWTDWLRPVDYATIGRNTAYPTHAYGASAYTNRLSFASVKGYLESGVRLNYRPAAGQAPNLAGCKRVELSMSLRPRFSGQALENTYILDHYASLNGAGTLFNSHIVRSKWTWQLTRALSVRVIGQYEAVLSNTALTSAPTTRKFTGDFLFTYLRNPGTAIYVGYTSGLSRPDPAASGVAGDRFVNDGRQVFLRVSYLFRP